MYLCDGFQSEAVELSRRMKLFALRLLDNILIDFLGMLYAFNKSVRVKTRGFGASGAFAVALRAVRPIVTVPRCGLLKPLLCIRRGVASSLSNSVRPDLDIASASSRGSRWFVASAQLKSAQRPAA
jgi:hypothetical protein